MTSVNKIIWISRVQFYDILPVCRKPTTQSQIFFCHHIFGPLYPLLPSSPFPLVTTILLFVSVSVYLFVCLVCSWVTFSFVSHIGVKSHGSWHFLWLCDILRIHPCCQKWQYFIFSHSQVEFHCMYVAHLLHPIIYWGTLRLFLCVGHCLIQFFKWTHYKN